MVGNGLPQEYAGGSSEETEARCTDEDRGSARSQETVMVVDDAPANLKLLRAQLRNENLNVTACVDGTSALAEAKREPPDLILLDINMPGMDGFEVCRRLKDDETLCDIPVLFLSARGQLLDKVEAFAVGGADYIEKPFQVAELISRIRTHLMIRRQRCELEQALTSLRALERMRDRMVQMFVHDLRSPLTVIQATLQLWMSEEESEERRQNGRRGLSSVRRMVRLINAILDIGSLESGRLVPNLRRVDVHDLLREAVDDVSLFAGGRTVRLTAPDSPMFAECEPDLVFRIIQNLLANAVEFTDRTFGRIEVNVSQEDDAFRIVVNDNGSGVSEQDQQLIFEKHAHTVFRPDSHGLGLAFSKMAVEAHGGRIGVTSGIDGGSAFWFTLPV